MKAIYKRLVGMGPIFVARGVFVLAVILFLLGCVSVSPIKFSEDREAAISATKKFQSLFNEQRFEEIYELTDSRARETKSKEGLISILTGLRNERGPVLKSDLIDANIDVRPTYRELHLAFRTKFEKAETVEKFTWYVSNNKASLFSYETQ